MRAGRRRGLPGDVLRRHLGRPGRLPAAHRPAERPRPLALRRRRHQAGPPAQGPGAAADGDVRRPARRAAGRPAAAAHRRHRRRGRAALAAGTTSRPTPGGPRPAAEPVPTARRRPSPPRSPHCGAVPLVGALHDRWGQADDLSLVAGMRRDHRARADRPPASRPSRRWPRAAPSELPRTIGRPSRERLAAAGPAAAGRADRPARPAYELLPRSPAAGCCGCPRPSDGDVYLDFEGDPFAADGAGREYLAGLWDRSGRFTTWWAHDPDAGAAELTRELLDDLTAGWRADPAHARLPLRGLRADRPEAADRRGTAPARPSSTRCCAASGSSTCTPSCGRGCGSASRPTRSRSSRTSTGAHTRTAADAGVADAMSSVVEYERLLVDGDAVGPGRRSPTTTATTCARPTTCTPGSRSGGRARAAARAPAPARPPRTASASEAQSDAEVAEAELADRLREPGTRCWPASSAGTGARSARSGGTSSGCKDLDDEALLDDAGRPSASCPRRSTTATSSSPSGGATSSRRRTPRCSEGRRKPLDVDTQARGRRGPRDRRRRRVAGDEGRAATGPRRTPRGLGPPKPPAVKVLQESIAHVGAQVLAGGPPLGRALLDRRVPAALQAPAGGAAGRPGGPGRPRPRR